MTTKNATKPTKAKNREMPANEKTIRPVIDGPAQTIYADKVVTIGIGSAISKITLGLEIDNNTILPSTHIVLPTPALFEALDFFYKTVSHNDELKESLIQSLDDFRTKLTAKSS